MGMEVKRIQKDNPSIYYELTVDELIELLQNNVENLDSLEVKWSSETGYEICNLHFRLA